MNQLGTVIDGDSIHWVSPETALYVLRGIIINNQHDRVTFSVIRHVSTR